MSDSFDPYYEWLGIPPDDQPPNYYQLLGIALFETNEKIIQYAADRQMSHSLAVQNPPKPEKGLDIVLGWVAERERRRK